MNLSSDKAIENQSITRRLTASLIITVLIVSAIAITAMHRVVSQAAIRGLERKADETLAYLVGTLEVPLWAVDDDGVRTIGRAVSQDGSIVRLIIRNESGVVIFSMEKDKNGDLVNRTGKIFHKQGNLEKPAGDVSVSMTPAIYKASDRRLLFFSMLIIVLILISVAIVTVIFIRAALNKPLKSLNELTDRFAAGRYDTSGHALPYREFQPFGQALTEMACTIEGQIGMVRKGEEDIRKLNAELEQRVKLRTAELEVAKERAEVANQAKSAFLSNMSHELRTPLNAIMGYAQILKLQDTLTDRQQQRLEIIRTSGEHLLTLINDILDVGKIEARKMELEEVTFDLPLLLRQAFNITRIKADEKDLSFHFEAGAVLPRYVRGDERKLRQILLNLLSNAVKYTHRGGVILRASHAGGELRCEVTDTGIGIAPDKLETIFEPFTQLAVEGLVREGTGLGLTITRELATLMRGRIAVESEPGKGSTFRLEVPLATVGEAELAKRSRKSVTGYRGERMRILVVDDNVTNASMLVSMLEPLGFPVATAGNGPEAVRLALEQRPDLVLLDLVMPEMDGLEAAREMRRHRELAESRIIGVSATVTESSRRDEFVAACDDFLAKPIQIDTLLDKIETLLGISWETALPEMPVAPVTEIREREREEVELPPPEEMLELHELALRGDMRKIEAWATALEERYSRYERFAGTLRELAGGYKANEILALLEDHKGK